jgi:DNA-binding MarR family transcriptional regulator
MDSAEADMELSRRVLLRLAQVGHEWSAQMREVGGGEALADNLAMVLLCRLYEDEWLRPMQLQEWVDITSGGMSKLIDRLEGAGLVARLSVRPLGDRRGVEVALTKKGSAALADVLAAITPSVKGLLADLEEIAEHHGATGSGTTRAQREG